MGWIYFIGTHDSEVPWVKIGYTSGDPYVRRQMLQTGCPLALDVLVYAPGTPQDERTLHARFAAFQGQGEWFAMEGSLQAYIVDLIARSPPMKPGETLWTDVYRREFIR